MVVAIFALHYTAHSIESSLMTMKKVHATKN